MTLLSADSFNRAFTGTPGSTDGAGTLDPLPWTVLAGSGTFGTISNRMTVITFGTGFPIITTDLGTANVDLQVTVANADINGFGIVSRFTDANNYIVLLGDTGSLILSKRVAGTSTPIVTGLGTLADGDILRLVADGNQLSPYKNGLLLGGPYTDSFNNTATKHGLRMQGDYTGQAADDWSASSIAAPVIPPPASGPGVFLQVFAGLEIDVASITYGHYE